MHGVSTFLYDKVAVVKRKTETLGQYNRPVKTFETVATYDAHVSEGSTNTAQMMIQKQNSTELTLYTYPEAQIHKGDVLFIYDKDEYGEAIEATEFKAIADKPYKKRTQLRVHLLSEAEV